jgi:alpha-N-arabinofuranosidase
VPTYDAKVADNVPYLDVTAVRNTGGKMLTFFLVNRHPDEAMTLDLSMAGFSAKSVEEHVTIAHSDLRATNTAKAPNRVVPTKGKGVGLRDGALKGKLSPRSWNMIRVRI